MSDGFTKTIREELDAQEARLASKLDEDIDFSDIPRVTDFSNWVRVLDYPDLATARAAARARKLAKLAAE